MELPDKKPDFKNLKNILMHSNRGRIPIFEALVADQIKEKILGKKINSIIDEIEFWVSTGYDYIPIPAGILKLGQSIEQAEAEKIYKGDKSSGNEEPIKWASEHDGFIKGFSDFKNYNWPDPDLMDFKDFALAARHLPENMKIIGVGGKIFTAVWMLMGFDNFCFKLYEQPEMVKIVFEKVAQLQYEVFRRIIELPDVEGYFVADDIAFSEGLMISAEILRKYVFPWYLKMGKICKRKGLPFIFHSDGNILEVLDDIIECGFTALHPIEPKAMDLGILCKKYGDKLCFIGNIELDSLIRADTRTVEGLVLKNLREIAEKYYYIVGSSNSIPEKVPISNYLAMVNTALK